MPGIKGLVVVVVGGGGGGGGAKIKSVNGMGTSAQFFLGVLILT